MKNRIVTLRTSFRFYPTPKQTQALARVFGACRYLYNWALRLRTDAYRLEDYTLTYKETSALLSRLKQTPDHAWLQELSCVPPQQGRNREGASPRSANRPGKGHHARS